MDEPNHPHVPVGGILPAELTVPNADAMRDFYSAVVGWDVEPMPMSDDQGDYSDDVMKHAEAGWAGGVCYRRGPNADQPPGWVVNVVVADLPASLQRCQELGGCVFRDMQFEDGTIVYALIQDPDGTILGLTRPMWLAAGY